MRLATYESEGRFRIGAVNGDAIVPLDHLAPDMLGLIAGGERILDAARRAMAEGHGAVSLERVRLLAPIPRPAKNIMAVGRNYAEHARESEVAMGDKPAPPVFFTKAPTTVNSPTGDIVVDAAVSLEIDWEVELGVIIGKPARKVRRESALEHIFGYTVLNDVSARDIQHRTSQYFLGKSVDGYCPMGPWIVTADDLPEPQNLNLRCRVNGVLKQESNTRDMLYDIPAMVEHLSLVLTCEPGDIIATGTPAGVGFARKPPEFLHPGDLLESEIEGIGTLRNRIVGPSSAA